jgi:AcrR family transcriptional regulator
VAESPARATDSRTLRTVQAIEDAVRDALQEVPLDELTIAEVCRRAGVGRPSFYTHFDSIPRLVAQLLTADVDNALPIPDVELVPTELLEPAITENLADALATVARHRELYRSVFRSASSGVLRSELDRAVGNRVRNIIAIWQARGVVGEVDLVVAVPFATGGITRALEAWAFDDSADSAGRARAIRDQMPRWWPFPD